MESKRELMEKLAEMLEKINAEAIDRLCVRLADLRIKESRPQDRLSSAAFSEVLHVRFLSLARRVEGSFDLFRRAPLRHQDRGGDDADAAMVPVTIPSLEERVAQLCATLPLSLGQEDFESCEMTRFWTATTNRWPRITRIVSMTAPRN